MFGYGESLTDIWRVLTNRDTANTEDRCADRAEGRRR